MANDIELDELMNSLSMDNVSHNHAETEVPKSDADIMHTLMGTMMEMIKTNTEQMKHAQEMSQTSGDSEHVEAYASVAKSQADLVKTLANMIMEKEKLKTNTALKEKELKLKEKAIDMKPAKTDMDKLPAGSTYIQNNIVVSETRENVMKMMFGKSDDEKRQKLIDKHFTPEVQPQPETLEAEVIENS